MRIGELRTAAADASSAFDRASDAANYARKSQTNFRFEVERWKLSHTYETREPLPVIEGNAHWDIAMPAPPTDEQVAALGKAATKANRKLNKTRQALTDAVAADQPKRKPSTTGYAATKNFRFLGVPYSVGDEFDPGVAAPEKFARLVGSRMVAPTSPAGVDHGS